MNRILALALPVAVGALAGYFMAAQLSRYQPWKKALELGATTAA